MINKHLTTPGSEFKANCCRHSAWLVRCLSRSFVKLCIFRGTHCLSVLIFNHWKCCVLPVSVERCHHYLHPINFFMDLWHTSDLHKASTWLLYVMTLTGVYKKGSVSPCIHTPHKSRSTATSVPLRFCPPPLLPSRLNIFLLTLRLSTAKHQSPKLLLWRIIESAVSSNPLPVAQNSAPGRKSASLDPLAPIQRDEFHTLFGAFTQD